MANQNKSAQDSGKLSKQGESIGEGNLDSRLSTDDSDNAGAVYSENLMNDADPDKQVRENEDASLQDDTYAFDSDNTGNEDYHDAFDGDEYDEDNFDDANI